MGDDGKGPSSAEDQDEELVDDSRQSGGDAPAAGSVADREAVAVDDDELFSDDG